MLPFRITWQAGILGECANQCVGEDPIEVCRDLKRPDMGARTRSAGEQ